MDNGLSNEGNGNGGFGLGDEDPIVSVLRINGSSSSGFGGDHALQGVKQFALPSYFHGDSGPESGSGFSSFVQMTNGISESKPASKLQSFPGFSSDNVCTRNLVPNMRSSTLGGFPNINPSISNNLPLNLYLTNSFYPTSVLPCNSVALLRTSQHRILPSVTSSMVITNNEVSDIGMSYKNPNNEVSDIGMSYKNPKVCLCHMNCRLTQSKQLMNPPLMEDLEDEFKDTELKLVIRKELSNSDVGTVGRIVLPKKEAEANLPPLTERESTILSMDDLELLVTWKFKYRFWPNNKSRMYIMESTGDFVKAHGLQAGDFFIIYRNSASQNFVVRGKKGRQRPATLGSMQCDCTNQCTLNEHSRLWLEYAQSSGQSGSETKYENRINHSPNMEFPHNLGSKNHGFHHSPQASVANDMSFEGYLEAKKKLKMSEKE